jgi:hypothetical protein
VLYAFINNVEMSEQFEHDLKLRVSVSFRILSILLFVKLFFRMLTALQLHSLAFERSLMIHEVVTDVHHEFMTISTVRSSNNMVI